MLHVDFEYVCINNMLIFIFRFFFRLGSRESSGWSRSPKIGVEGTPQRFPATRQKCGGGEPGRRAADTGGCSAGVAI